MFSDEFIMLTGDDPATLRTLGDQCRRLSRGASTPEVSASLSEMAADYERAADKAEAAERLLQPKTR
ncbi:MAG TPA: hypothetical protein VF552_04780 [Allosphingosinicella sp.]|jgi:hypothetical protein